MIFNKFPLYKEAQPDLLLIGVHHQEIGLLELLKVRKFIKTIVGLDHLFLEGRGPIHALNKSMGKINFEQIALDAYEGEKHFLDIDSDYGPALRQQGISPLLFGSLKAASSLLQAVRLSPTHPECVANLKKFLEIGQMIGYPGMQHVSIPEVMRVLSAVLERALAEPKTLSAVYGGGKEFQTYLARLRDYKIYYPKIKKLLPELTGKKGAVVGGSHIHCIHDLLTGELQENGMPTWEDFKTELDESSQRGIQIIENLVEHAEQK